MHVCMRVHACHTNASPEQGLKKIQHATSTTSSRRSCPDITQILNMQDFCHFLQAIYSFSTKAPISVSFSQPIYSYFNDHTYSKEAVLYVRCSGLLTQPVTVGISLQFIGVGLKELCRTENNCLEHLVHISALKCDMYCRTSLIGSCFVQFPGSNVRD